MHYPTDLLDITREFIARAATMPAHEIHEDRTQLILCFREQHLVHHPLYLDMLKAADSALYAGQKSMRKFLR